MVSAVGRTDECAVHGVVPQAGLHHTALIVLALVAVLLFGATEDERTRARVERRELLSAHLQATVVECHQAVRLVQHQGHLLEDVLRHLLAGRQGLAVHHGL